MKTKKALHAKVIELSSQLPKISEKQENWASESVFLKWGVVSRNKLNCLECSHVWKPESKKKIKCPNCKSTLKLFGFNQTHFQEKEYFAVLTTIENFQVVRIISSRKWMKKNEKPSYFHSEVMQHFIDENGKVTTLSKSVQGFTMEYDIWIHNSALTVKESSQRGSLRFRINPWKIYPHTKVLPVLKRNGFKSSVHGIAPQILFTSILSNSQTETLLKTGQFNALKYYLYDSSNHVSDLWNTIKICTKNNYLVKDFSIYKDYIDLLKFFNKDTHSPKYICPADLHRAHDRLVAKKAEIDRRKKLEDIKKEIQKSQKKYLKEKKAFFGLQFSDGKISIKVIEHVKDFLAEGDELGHCVFRNEYYKKTNSLVLSATIGEKRIETIEISLSKMSISQARGQKNKPTKYHDKIIDMVTQNMPKINKIYKENLKQVA
jgi:hypothetical protein